MRKAVFQTVIAAALALGLAALGHAAWAQDTPPASAATATPEPTVLATGWVLLKEGQAEGAIETDAKHPTNPSAHLLKISVTKYPDIGKGRLGAKNSQAIAVKQGAAYDITFAGAKEGAASYGVGLVVSLETDDGTVLARTTLPEIGRGGGRRGGGAAGSTWPSYLVNLRARASSPNAHLTITAIEPYSVWLDNIAIVERPAAP
jgi:hypothetical protein